MSAAVASSSSSYPASSSGATTQIEDEDNFESIDLLTDASKLLQAVQKAAENVTTCHNQITQIFHRCQILLASFYTEGGKLNPAKIEETSKKIEDLLKRLHRNMQRFAIYGRVKAFVHRRELAAYIESFNVEIDQVFSIFTENQENWKIEYEEEKGKDILAWYGQLGNMLTGPEAPADIKTVFSLGLEAVQDLYQSLTDLQDWLGHHENPNDLVELGDEIIEDLDELNFRIESIKTLTHSRLVELEKPGANEGESEAARAKREEAEWEMITSRERERNNDEDYSEPPPPAFTFSSNPPPPPAQASSSGSRSAPSDLPPGYSA